MTGWTAIVPVKPLGLAKSRLRLPPAVRHSIAAAMVEDTFGVLAASLAIAQVVVVTADVSVRGRAAQRGWRTVEDRPLLVADPLNEAVAAGTRVAAVAAMSGSIVVVPIDLPALSGVVLDQVLESLQAHDRAFVPDLEGTGTSLLAAADPSLLAPRLGPRSATAHARAGAWRHGSAPATARLDVDTVQDLSTAASFRVGPALRHQLTLHRRRLPAVQGVLATAGSR